ncbi:hypothetical protein AAMO2058_001713400 [Amorphochlora amoebiformis]
MDGKEATRRQEELSWIQDRPAEEIVRTSLTNERDLVMILRVFERTSAPDGVCKALSDVFLRAGKQEPLIRAVVSLETKRARSEATIFRGNNALSRLAIEAIRKFIDELDHELESIVPSYLDEIHQENNDVTIAKYVDMIVKACTPISTFSGYHMFLKHLYRSLQERFPSTTLRVISGFIFLRILSPRILTFYPSNNAVTEREHRLLVNLVKAVQRVFLPSTRSAAIPNPYSTQIHNYIEAKANPPDSKRSMGNFMSPTVTCLEEGRTPKRQNCDDEDLEWGKDMEALATYLEILRPAMTKSVGAFAQALLTGRHVGRISPELQHHLIYGGILITLMSLYVLRLWATTRFGGEDKG